MVRDYDLEDTAAIESPKFSGSDLLHQASLHLLVVEDVEMDVELIVMTLQAAGVQFTYDAADNESNCQQLLHAHTYDAVLSDYRLPGFTGHQVFALVQALNQEIPFILVTGNLGEEAAVECIKSGMTDYVLKDRLFRLPTVLARSLEEFQLRRQKQAAIEQIQLQAQRERSLNQISRVLNSSLDPAYILQEIVRLTGESFGVDRVALFSLDHEQVEVRNEWRASQDVVSTLGYRAPLAEWVDLLGPSSSSGLHQVFHAPNYLESHPAPAEALQLHSVQVLSILRVPIFIREHFFGGLSLQTIHLQRTFTADEIELLQGIADQAAIALYNAQSYERLEQLVQARTQELEAAKLVAETANRAKSEFLANVSHELRTPLAGILSLAQVLSQQLLGPLNEKQQQYIHTIRSSGQHLQELINDLLDLSKIEAGREELHWATIMVEKLCQTCLSLIRERAHSHQIELSLHIDPNVTTCMADERRLKQILFNLLSNAVKFTPTGSVTLDVTQHDSTIHFAVIDTGIGIAQADQTRIFQPFQQLETELSEAGDGTGLGLPLARQLAQLHGGDIKLSSVPHEGSCFSLILPLHPSPEAAALASES